MRDAELVVLTFFFISLLIANRTALKNKYTIFSLVKDREPHTELKGFVRFGVIRASFDQKRQCSVFWVRFCFR